MSKVFMTGRYLTPGTIRFGFEIIKWEKRLLNRINETLSLYRVKCLKCNFEFSSTINKLKSKCTNCNAKSNHETIKDDNKIIVHYGAHYQPGTIRHKKEVIEYIGQTEVKGVKRSKYKVRCLKCNDVFITAQVQKACAKCKKVKDDNFKSRIQNLFKNNTTSYIDLPEETSMPMSISCPTCEFRGNPELLKQKLIEKLEDPITSSIFDKCIFALFANTIYINITDKSGYLREFLNVTEATWHPIINEIMTKEYKVELVSSSDDKVQDRFE